MSRQRDRRGDRGFTLIEIVIAVSLSVVMIGVLVSVLLTSMRITDATNAQVHDSTDVGQISAFLFRDAASAGGTDPLTALVNTALGVSVTDAAGCVGSGTLVVRFSWADHPTPATSVAYVASYSLTSAGQLTRRLCVAGVPTDVPLGNNVASASASCAPSCAGLPTTVSLTIRGIGVGAPLQTTLTATVRAKVPNAPATSNSSSISLIALGDLGTSAPCPVLSMTGTNAVTVIGDAVVSSSCGAGGISDPLVQLAPLAPGSRTTTAQLNDPFAALVAPSATCPASGTNPGVGAHDADPNVPTVYPNLVTVSTTVTFAAGQYVFCKGLTISSGASVSGAGAVFFYVPSGAVSIAGGATVDLAAATSGAYANVVLWASGGQAVGVQLGATVGSYRGFIYAPRSALTITSTGSALPANIGGLIARTITFTSAGSVRFGPVPTISITPTTLPTGTAGTPYGPVTFVAGGEATLPATWQSTGLIGGLSLGASTGTVAGTPTCSGTSAVVVATSDATKAAASRAATLTITPSAALDDPGTTVRSTVNLALAASTPCSGGSTVTFQSKLTTATDVPGSWTTVCTDTVAPFTCAWVTPAGRADEYDLRATVTDAGGAGVDDVIGVMADNVAPTVAMSAPTNSSTISGLATVSATAVDAATDVSDVVFQISAAGANTWSPLCTGTEVVPGTFSCQIDTTAFAFGSYDIRATATDVSGCDVVTVCPITGNTATATSTSVKIDNTVSSLNMIALPATIAGTVSVKADAISSKPIAVTFQYQPAGSSTWTSIGCTPTITGTTYACSFNTIAVADGGITFRATMVETGGTTLTATTASTVANVTVAGYDIQATNVSTSGKIVKNDKITYTYNTLMKYTSILSGWTGASQTVYVRLRDGSAAGTGTGTDDLIDVSNSTTFPVIGTTSTSVALGAINLKNDYITTAGKSLIYKATMVATTVNSRTVVTITLGALSSGTSSTLVQSTVAKAMVWTPSSLATNSTGVACSITPVTETGTLDIDF